ncbi:MAG: cytochrome ubiquinol oxidase subunit I [Planctomycetota bacterium]|jgi:cytochrome d ubiquinol oxidase subunit I
MDQLDLHRLHFGFTIVFHYLFPQLTMGLALLLLVLKTRALRGDAASDGAVRFWSKIFGVTFLMGVVTGIPMEFQFGTNWSRFSAAAGGVIGQTLAMEGVFAFFLESSFLYLVLFGEKRLGPRGHWIAILLLFAGTWLSGYFIVCTNAWMQHPVGYDLAADGSIALSSLGALLTNPWAIHQYLHTMAGTVITASFAMASIGAYYVLHGEHLDVARRCTATAVVTGLIASLLAGFPTGDVQAKLVYEHQPATFAAMEGHFHTEDGAGLVIVGQPNMETLHLDNPIVVPRVLSFLTHQRWDATITGRADFERDRWPTNVPMLDYAYHIMAGLGTIFIAIMALGTFFLWRGTLYDRRWLLWILMLALPFPFIANTAGWMTAELGRQPWIIYGLLRTADGHSTNVSAGNTAFTLLGFAGLYLLLAVLYFFVTTRIIARGPQAAEA